MSTILVTGASGFVGSHVVPVLVDAGHRVVALVRTDASRASSSGAVSCRASARTSRSGSAT